jgi:hypothetical protein
LGTQDNTEQSGCTQKVQALKLHELLHQMLGHRMVTMLQIYINLALTCVLISFAAILLLLLVLTRAQCMYNYALSYE